MPYLAGYQAKLLINGTRCKFRRLRVRTMVRGINTNNSEGFGAPVATPGFDTEINGAGRIEIDFEDVSFDPLANLWLPPFSIAAGVFITVQILPAGVGGVSYFSPSFRVAEMDHTMDAGPDGAQPLSFRGQGNGSWSNPTA
jgi:hypothetical protein